MSREGAHALRKEDEQALVSALRSAYAFSSGHPLWDTEVLEAILQRLATLYTHEVANDSFRRWVSTYKRDSPNWKTTRIALLRLSSVERACIEKGAYSGLFLAAHPAPVWHRHERYELFRLYEPGITRGDSGRVSNLIRIWSDEGRRPASLPSASAASRSDLKPILDELLDPLTSPLRAQELTRSLLDRAKPDDANMLRGAMRSNASPHTRWRVLEVMASRAPEAAFEEASRILAQRPLPQDELTLGSASTLRSLPTSGQRRSAVRDTTLRALDALPAEFERAPLSLLIAQQLLYLLARVTISTDASRLLELVKKRRFGVFDAICSALESVLATADDTELSTTTEAVADVMLPLLSAWCDPAVLDNADMYSRASRCIGILMSTMEPSVMTETGTRVRETKSASLAITARRRLEDALARRSAVHGDLPAEKRSAIINLERLLTAS